MANQNSPNAHRRNRKHIKSTRNPRNLKANCLKSQSPAHYENRLQSLKRHPHKDWRQKTKAQSLKWQPHKDWRQKNYNQSLKWHHHKDWKQKKPSPSRDWTGSVG